MQSVVEQLYAFWPESMHWLIPYWGWHCIGVGTVFVLLIGSGLIRQLALGSQMTNKATGRPMPTRLIFVYCLTFIGIGSLLIWLGLAIVN